MRCLMTAIFFTVVITVSAASVLAQADAQKAYEAGKTAYAAGEFEKARDLARTASQTDPRNPEVLLLLGKAHYQLGELSEAVTAWKRTLALAPEEPYARRMLEAVRGEKTDVDLRIRLAEAMLAEKLAAAAGRECSRLLDDKALTDAQRAEVMTLQAETALPLGQPDEAQRIVRKVLVMYPKHADAARTTLLLGRAKLLAGGESTAEGIELLEKIVADHADTPVATTARLELITFRLQQGVSEDRAGALAQWLSQSPEHPEVTAALETLLDAYLAVTLQGPQPSVESKLAPSDVKALALATQLYNRNVRAKDAKKLTDKLLAYLGSHYSNNGAFAAAVDGVERLLAAPLPRDSRLAALCALARHKTSLAMRQLQQQAVAGELPREAARGELPEGLKQVTEVHETIANEYPSQALWGERAALAEQVRAYAARVLPAPEFAGLNGPEAWAVDIALPVIRADADAAAVSASITTVQRVVQAHAEATMPEPRRLAIELSKQLVTALAPAHADWSTVMTAHAKLLDEYARFQFQENVESGRAAGNAQLSDAQKWLLETLRGHIAREANRADGALELLGRHLEPWRQNRHWSVVEGAYQGLLPALPAMQRRRGELAIVQTRIQQVLIEHRRMLSAGLTVPRQLDPRLAEALTRCYELQAALDEQASLLAESRAASDAIISHYKALEYYDVAETAARVKAEKPIALADEYTAFQLARLADEHARRELSRRLRQYGASDEIELTAEFQAAIDAWTGLIADYPTSDLVAQAVSHVLAIGQVFESHQAHAVAATIYGEFARFASGIPMLSQPVPGGMNVEQRAALARVAALDAEARKGLAEAQQDREPDDPPPSEISEEFVIAIDAGYALIERYPDSPVVRQAIDKILAVAFEYAKIDAWDVADAVYADLLESDLQIRRVERLKFARGLCQLGRAMPDHAREVLQALTVGGLRGSSGETATDEEMLLAYDDSDELSTAIGSVSGLRNSGGYAEGGGPGEAGGWDSPADPAPDSSTRPNAGPPTTAPREPAAPADRESSRRDAQLLAMIRQQEANRAGQVAQLRERVAFNQPVHEDFARHANMARNGRQQEMQQAAQGQQAVPVLSEAELKRQQKAIDAAYGIFQAIRNDHPHTPTAEQARAEVMVMIGHWRTLTEWERSVALAGQYLADNPKDGELPKLRLEIARDRLAWAAKPLPGKATKQERLDAVSERFDAARDELARIVADFPEQRGYQQQAQWDIANSYLKQARVVAAFSNVLARGQFVRTAKELTQVAREYPDHPQVGTIPQMIWNVAGELEGRGFYEEAILVWNELILYDPMHGLSQQASLKIAQTYHQQLERPLKAAEAYQEVNFARGGSDQGLQNAIFQIGQSLKNEQRWVEALHVLETFVDSFPRHPQAGQALTMVGQIHQTNEAWEDAIAAYRRVIDEFEDGQFVHDAKWSIAECTINLSRWPEAMAAYRDYVQAYPKDAKLAEANRRIEVLKDLARYQGLVDEEGQRKAFDAQYQIAEIVKTQLSNPVKAIIEYRKVVEEWPDSHLADDALYAVGATYLSLEETVTARRALREMAERYPASPLADDALFLVGRSFEEEADRLATVTREESLERAKEVTQRRAYEQAQSGRRAQQKLRGDRIAGLKAAGKGKKAELEEAATAANYGQFNDANVRLFAQKAEQDVETLSAAQLADREDKINAALRKAVEAYRATARVAAADKADEALLQMATIFDQRLKDSEAAMETWLEIVRQFSGTAVAEDASWRIARYYERARKHAEAIEAYESFLRNYRRSPKAGDAQFAIAENHEHLGQWISAMDSYKNYLTNFPDGPLAQKAKEQINWIKTYRL